MREARTEGRTLVWRPNRSISAFRQVRRNRGRSEKGIGPRGPSRGACLCSPALAGLDLPSQRFRADLGHPVVARSADLATSVKVIDLTVGGVRVTLTPTASSRAERSPDMQESARFVDLADQVLERFRPHVLLTYGGYPACLELMRGTRMKSGAVVFILHHSITMSAVSLTT